jgi:hypothetical protein
MKITKENLKGQWRSVWGFRCDYGRREISAEVRSQVEGGINHQERQDDIQRVIDSAFWTLPQPLLYVS